MRIRVRSAAGTQIVNDIQDSTTFGDLVSKVALIAHAPSHQLQLKIGFPPVMMIHPAQTTVGELKFQDGEMITVGVDPSGANVSLPASSSLSSTSQPSTVATSQVSANDNERKMPSSAPVATAATTSTNTSNSSSSNANSNTTTTNSRPTRHAPAFLHDGVAVRREVPSDNSCLFRAFAKSYPASGMNTSALRNLIARAVGADPIEYNDAVLGKPVHDYQKWIKNEDHWGGAIELAILSRHFQLEIAACDIKTGNMIIFGEGCGYSERIYLAYDGIHYDFLAINPVENGPEDIDITVFHPDDGWVKRAMEDTVDLLRASGLYTDTHAFRLKCGKCGHIAIGERGAMEHMQDTGHMDFDEVR